jgi:hypothetical protein
MELLIGGCVVIVVALLWASGALLRLCTVLAGSMAAAEAEQVDDGGADHEARDAVWRDGEPAVAVRAQSVVLAARR